MTKTYDKRIWCQGDVSVYVSVVDSKPTSWRVVHSRITKASFTARDTAIVYATKMLSNNEGGPQSTDERALFEEKAKKLDLQKPLDGPLDIRLLAALEAARLSRETSSAARVDVALAIGALCSECGAIPLGSDDLIIWAQNAMGCIVKKSNRNIRTKSALDVRVQSLKRILKMIDTHPIVFKRWATASPLLQNRIDVLKKGLLSEFEELESFEPLAKSEIEKLLSEQNSFENVCYVLLYLTSGLRVGEVERLKRDHLIKDKLTLSKVVTKTRSTRNPTVSLVFRACFNWLNYKIPLVVLNVERKRFRPTSAVNLLLSNVSSLEVMERLGWATQSMLNNHYAKMLPSDWGSARTASEYYGVRQVSVNGMACNENAWDNYLLYMALTCAKKFNIVGFKSTVERELGSEVKVDLLTAADF